MNKVYLAARYSRLEEMRQLQQELESAGFVVTSRWLNGSHRMDPNADDPHVETARFAREDYEDVVAADYVVVIAEEPRTPTRGGRLVEMGIGLGRNKHVLGVGCRENVFFHLPGIELVDDVDDVVGILVEHANLADPKLYGFAWGWRDAEYDYIP